MKKLYKYLAVAACALLGAGSASAEMYVLTYDGSVWTNHQMTQTSDNTYTYGAVFKTGNLVLFQAENRSQPDWTTTDGYISESTSGDNYWITDSGKSVDCSLNQRRCFEFNKTGGFQEGYYLMTLTDNGDNKYTAKFEYDTSVKEPITDVPYFHYSDENGDNWDLDHAMFHSGSYVYTETRDFKAGCYFKISTSNNSWDEINNNAYGVNASDVDAEDYLDTTATITKGNSGSFKISVAGTYIVVVNFSDKDNPTINITRNSSTGGDDDDITLDDNGTTYSTTPKIADLMLAYWVGEQQSRSDSHKYIIFNNYEQGSLSGTKFGWAKYEDTSKYNGGMIDAGDTDEIMENETAEHDCKNFSDAYYRFYQYTLNSHPSLSTPTPATGVRAPRAVPAQGIEHSRVARTFAMKDNTTGVDDIVTDGGTSVEDTDAPVIWYNLQGQRVNNPSGGVYIRQQGSKVTKEYIR